MMDLNNAVSVLMKGVDSAVTEAGFTLVRPENIEKDALPITVDKETEKTFIDYAGDNGKIRIQIDGVKLSLLFSEDDGEYKSASENYFDSKDFDERDVKSLCNELNETILQKYGKTEPPAARPRKYPFRFRKPLLKTELRLMTATLSQTAFPLCTPTSSRITRKILRSTASSCPTPSLPSTLIPIL